MNRDQAQLLLGGYATGTLTPEERKMLLQASLDHQELFDALADEEALRELLADPAARRRLLEVLAPAPRGVRWFHWLWRPIPVAALATFAVAVIGIALLRQQAYGPKQVAMSVPQRAPVMEEARAPEPDPLPPAAPARSKPRPMPKQPAAEAGAALPKDSLEAKQAEPFATAEAESRRDAVAAAPPPAAPSPAAPPALADAKVAEKKKEELAKSVSAPAPLPFRYRIEREQRPGEWVEYGAELSAGDRVRLRVDATQPGYVQLRPASGAVVTRQAAASEPVYFPVESSAGERVVALTWSRTAPVAGSALGNTVGFRQRAPAARAEADEASVATAPRVEIRLRFR